METLLGQYGRRVDFVDAPKSVTRIRPTEGNIAPPDTQRLQECARVYVETGGKLGETARRMGVCPQTVQRDLAEARDLGLAL
jgi:ActR/RegA family two-component response regulator